jgi:hypothetical protein
MSEPWVTAPSDGSIHLQSVASRMDVHGGPRQIVYTRTWSGNDSRALADLRLTSALQRPLNAPAIYDPFFFFLLGGHLPPGEAQPIHGRTPA